MMTQQLFDAGLVNLGLAGRSPMHDDAGLRPLLTGGGAWPKPAPKPLPNRALMT